MPMGVAQCRSLPAAALGGRRLCTRMELRQLPSEQRGHRRRQRALLGGARRAERRRHAQLIIINQRTRRPPPTEPRVKRRRPLPHHYYVMPAAVSYYYLSSTSESEPYQYLYRDVYNGVKYWILQARCRFSCCRLLLAGCCFELPHLTSAPCLHLYPGLLATDLVDRFRRALLLRVNLRT